MGNYMSCMSPAALTRLQSSSDSSQNLIKLLHYETGAVSELEGPLTAAEVMIEFPAQFLSCFSNAGRRICAVPADEELRAVELYLLLPMHKLNKRFSREEMAYFAALEAAKKSGKQPGKGAISQSKVAPFPASTESSKAEGLVGNSIFKQVGAQESMNLQGPAALLMMGAAKNGMCRSKSWIPKLETITESAVAS